ncbi:MAG: hypothetical protein ACLGHO_05285 [Gammaproteobacteria bacterium]
MMFTVSTISAFSEQQSKWWHPDDWGEDGPWLRIFRNARVWVG